MRSTALGPRTTSLSFLATLGIGAVLAVLTGLALSNLIVAATLLYAIVFMAVAWNRPDMALLFVLISAPFQQDISGGAEGGPIKFSIAEIHLVLTFLVFLIQRMIRRRPLSLGPITIPVLLYFAICLFSSLHNGLGKDTLVSFAQMFLYLVATVLLFSQFAQKAEHLLLALNGLVCVGVALSVMELIGGIVPLGLNKNGMGASLSCAVIVAAELWFGANDAKRKRLLALALAITAAGLVFTLSRGAWLGTLSGLVVIAILRGLFRFSLRASLVLVPLVAVCWHLLPQESREYAADLRPVSYNVKARLDSIDLAKGYFEQSPLYGVGVGLRKEYDATNVFWSTLAETGILGLAALLLIHAAFFGMVWASQRQFARTDRLYSLLSIGAALVLDKLVHGQVDHYWSRGALLITWASAGMATRAYYLARRGRRTTGERA